MKCLKSLGYYMNCFEIDFFNHVFVFDSSESNVICMKFTLLDTAHLSVLIL